MLPAGVTHLYLAWGEAEAQRAGMACPGSHSCGGQPWQAQAQLQYFPHQISPWNILE